MQRTIKDVAKRAGSSPSTVSRVLNRSGYVSPETQRRVEEAATELGYHPNWLARGLKANLHTSSVSSSRIFPTRITPQSRRP